MQPVCIRYPHTHFNPSFPMGTSLAWLSFQLLCQFVNKVEVHFLDAYVPSEQERSSPSLFAHNVREVMAKHLGVKTTDFTYEDALLMNEGSSFNLPFFFLFKWAWRVKNIYLISPIFSPLIAYALNMRPQSVNVAVQTVKQIFNEMTLKVTSTLCVLP